MIVMEGGERLPLLIDADGVPLFWPNAWLLTMRRPAHRASNTLQANCYALKFLYVWAAESGNDIEGRMLSGQFLKSHEITSLAGAASRHLDGGGDDVRSKPLKARRVVSLEQVRMGAPEVPRTVLKHTAANRLRTVVQYLTWLGQEGSNDLDLETASKRKVQLDAMAATLNEKVPRTKGRNVVGQREAPPVEVMDRLLAVLEPDSPDNPWTDLGLRLRNRLVVHLLYGLGIRRGEALGIKITDHVQWHQNRILIARNADDPTDPRKRQPVAKTRDRILPVKDKLMDMMQEYVTHIRSKIPGARRGQFLIVAHDSGRPLSEAAMNKIFINLRERVVDLPESLAPHILRHAWNDAFSRLIDAKNVGPEREAQLRSQAMGWSPTSGTAATYNRRKIIEDTEKISLEHQGKLLPKGLK
ncbi:phage integrase family protein [Azospirillum brasilense]|nr:phage integrase family protein [Azospirillum brasilense]